jgi:predicted pyridoxine 5'-phosphate oxidase superfamily flavin-nucleotide-binding protein
MSDFYHGRSRELQDRFDTRRLADRIEERLVVDHIGDADRAFIESRDMFFLATTDAEGLPSCSYKGGDPGFVRVVDAHTIVFPNFDGNGMFLSMGNVLQTRKVGLLFIDFEKPRRLRLSGEASIALDDPWLADCPEAQFIVRIAVTKVFPNCPRYIHRYALIERSSYVPHAGCATPVPNWKKSDWASDVLPKDDSARKA